MWNTIVFLIRWVPVFILLVPLHLVKSIMRYWQRWISRTPKLRLPTDQDQFRQEIEAIIPLGSSLARAKRILRLNGFVISTVEEEGRQMVFADRGKAYLRALFLVGWRWYVGLSYEDECISSLYVGSHDNAV